VPGHYPRVGLADGAERWWDGRMARRRSAAVLALLAPVLVAGCGPTARHAPAAAPPADPRRHAAQVVRHLDDVDLVGQVLMPFAYGLEADRVEPAMATRNRQLTGVDTPADMVRRYHLGGVILVDVATDDPTAVTNPTTNVDSPAQVRRLTDGLQRAAAGLPAGGPLLVGTDQEYGVVTRIRSGMVQLPAAMALGAAARPDLTRRAWAAAGAELAALGINVDFAPDADVLGAGNHAIGSRSYGSDPAAVSEQVAAAVAGLRDAGVAATLKHFPGHGHTTADSHSTLPVLTADPAALDRDDLPPFRSGIAAGADLVMSGHLDARSVDPGIPASFSRPVLVDLLRGRLGFQGVTVTDAMNMAPARRWPPGEAAVRAILAGNDLLLMPPDLAAAQRGLLDALRSGRLPRQRLVEAATRVMTLRYRLGAHPTPPAGPLDTPAHRAAAGAVAAAAVTVLRGGCQGPLVRGPVSVTTSAGRDRQRDWLTEALRAAGAQVVAAGGTRVHLVGYGDAAADLDQRAAVTVAMDDPTLLRLSRSPRLLATYSSSQASMVGLAGVLTGRSPAAGRSPVAVPGLPRSACSG
jgi:beta-N-acetylhexosaminidase